MPEGMERPEGDFSKGERPEGDFPDGERPEGERKEWERPEGEMPEISGEMTPPDGNGGMMGGMPGGNTVPGGETSQTFTIVKGGNQFLGVAPIE